MRRKLKASFSLLSFSLNHRQLHEIRLGGRPWRKQVRCQEHSANSVKPLLLSRLCCGLKQVFWLCGFWYPHLTNGELDYRTFETSRLDIFWFCLEYQIPVRTWLNKNVKRFPGFLALVCLSLTGVARMIVGGRSSLSFLMGVRGLAMITQHISHPTHLSLSLCQWPQTLANKMQAQQKRPYAEGSHFRDKSEFTLTK